MSGWVVLVALVALGIGALRLLGARGALLQLGGAALLFGAAGYSLQGRPSLAGSPAGASSTAAPIPLTTIRHTFYGNFTASEHWLLIAESYARRGASEDAAGVLRSAVRAHPRDPALWVGLGNALVDHAGMLTPAAELAFARAAELAPGHPAAPFFLGLARARSGDKAGALALWNEVLASAPANASWRPLVEDAAAALR
ncbi:MAG: tetratricopeptide repeat protein [Sphingomicrobium sp.]